MKSTESFLATITLGVLALLVVTIAAIVLDNALALVVIAVAACLAYTTQAAATVAAFYEDAAASMHVDDEAGMIATLKAAMRWQKISLALWLATLIAGAAALALLVLSVL